MVTIIVSLLTSSLHYFINMDAKYREAVLLLRTNASISNQFLKKPIFTDEISTFFYDEAEESAKAAERGQIVYAEKEFYGGVMFLILESNYTLAQELLTKYPNQVFAEYVLLWPIKQKLPAPLSKLIVERIFGHPEKRKANVITFLDMIPRMVKNSGLTPNSILASECLDYAAARDKTCAVPKTSVKKTPPSRDRSPPRKRKETPKPDVIDV